MSDSAEIPLLACASIKLGREEQRFLRGEYGHRSRVWSMPADMGDQKPMAPGKPMSAPARPSCTYTHYEIRIRQKGVLLPIAAEQCDTLSQAQESAAQRYRAMGLPEYFEVAAEELRTLDQDGIYLVTCTTRHEAVMI